MIPLAGSIALGLGLIFPAEGDAPPPVATFAALGEDGTRDFLIFGEDRPIFVRLRLLIGPQSLAQAWTNAVRSLHVRLDRDHDGKLTTTEADAGGLSLLLGAKGKGEVDINPKDGVVAIDELTAAMSESNPPLRLVADRGSERRSDVLFDQIDRDKDGAISKSEMATIVGSLHGLDRDDDELIDVEEVNRLDPMAATAMTGQPARDPGVPPLVEITAGESPIRVTRLLIKKYDHSSPSSATRRDSRLSPEEIALPAVTFAACDANRDGLLGTDDLRTYLAKADRDLYLDVAFPANMAESPQIAARGVDGNPPAGMKIRPLGRSVVEIDVGNLRLDIHLESGANATTAPRKILRALFATADANQDGYLNEDEVSTDNGQPAPLAPLFAALKKDGKLYLENLEEYLNLQAQAAIARLTLTASDEGKALFGILDLDRDRRLGAREVLDTYSRVAACDLDHDGRVTPAEIPHHIQITLTRGELGDILPTSTDNTAQVNVVRIIPPPRAATRSTTGPAWFRKMDRNHDGDVSRREFLGTREQFDRLDHDHDGLVAPDEAEAATPVKAPGG